MKKVLLAILIISMIQSISSASQFGGFDAGSLNSQYTRDLRIHEAVTRSKNKNAIINTTKKETEQKVNSEIKSIVFVNNRVVSNEQLQYLVKNKINKPMTAENVSSIRKEVMRYYQSLGYYSAIAMVSSENTETGEIVIDINEGTRNSISIQN